jgi:hypothetical protein
MTYTFREQKSSDKHNSHKSLTATQRLLFTLFCWGTQSWGQADNFEAKGYDQKSLEARKAMRLGLSMYAVIFTLFIAYLIIS